MHKQRPAQKLQSKVEKKQHPNKQVYLDFTVCIALMTSNVSLAEQSKFLQEAQGLDGNNPTFAEGSVIAISEILNN